MPRDLQVVIDKHTQYEGIHIYYYRYLSITVADINIPL